MENLGMIHRLRSWYDGKKVLVTGHTGFKGAWLTALLYQAGARVKGYALAPEYEHGLYKVLAPLGIAESVIADIRDKERLNQEIVSFRPDLVFHLAAQPLVRRSYEMPADTFDINVTGTANLLESLHRLSHPCKIVVITTDKVYENKEEEDIHYREDDMLGGHDPYSASKACTELVVSSFRKSFFNSAVDGAAKAISSARAGNVIGGGDWSKDRIIPDIVRALATSRPVEVRNPASVRPWQHVLEPLCGYLLLGGLLQDDPVKYSHAYNFGPRPEDHLTVQELVEVSIDAWGGGQWKDISAGGQPHEASLLKLDIGRAIGELGWAPRLTAPEAIRWTIGWYKQPEKNLAEYTFEQIKAYLSL